MVCVCVADLGAEAACTREALRHLIRRQGPPLAPAAPRVVLRHAILRAVAILPCPACGVVVWGVLLLLHLGLLLDGSQRGRGIASRRGMDRILPRLLHLQQPCWLAFTRRSKVFRLHSCVVVCRPFDSLTRRRQYSSLLVNLSHSLPPCTIT